MGNKKRRSKRAQSPSLERVLSVSDVGTSQGNEAIIETLSNFENVSSVREGEKAFVSSAKNEDETSMDPKNN